MKKNKKIQALLTEAGNLMEIGKNEITATVHTRKNIITATILALFAFILIGNITYGPLRYTGVSIHDFIKLWKFL
jgi:hypothetical protein